MADDPNRKVQLKVTFNSQSVTFSTRREKPLVKVFNNFSNRLGLPENALRFYYNEARIRPEQNPAELNMDDEDEIGAAVQQEGGKSAVGC